MIHQIRDRAFRRRMFWTCVAVAGTLTCAAVAVNAGSAPRNLRTVGAAEYTVTVDRGSVERVVPASFVGVSTEYWAIERYAGPNPANTNTVLARLVRGLAPGNSPVIRIGGISSDRTWWPVPGIRRPIGNNFALNPRRIAVIKAFAEAAHAGLILGINLESDVKEIAAVESQRLLVGVGRDRVRALELGNEPELYSWAWFIRRDGERVPGRPSGYTPASYVRDFEHIARGLPPIPLADPASGSVTWLSSLGDFLRAERRIAIVTVHRYPTSQCFSSPGSSNYPTVARLLSPVSSAGLATALVPVIAVSHARRLPLRVDEMNAVACGKGSGTSETFVTALWVMDALFADLQAGVDGVNITTYPGAPGQLFTFTRSHGRWEGSVKPEYYGLLMFDRAAPSGSRLLRVSGTRNPVRVWATQGPNGTISVLVINDDTGRAHTLDLSIPEARRVALLERLLAPGIAATRGVMLAGQAFGSRTASGELTGRMRTNRLVPVAGTYRVTMPSASAALLTVR